MSPDCCILNSLGYAILIRLLLCDNLSKKLYISDRYRFYPTSNLRWHYQDTIQTNFLPCLEYQNKKYSWEIHQHLRSCVASLLEYSRRNSSRLSRRALYSPKGILVAPILLRHTPIEPL